MPAVGLYTTVTPVRLWDPTCRHPCPRQPAGSALEALGGRLGQVDAALGRLGADSQEGLRGLRELAGGVRRLESKLDRLLAAFSASEAAGGARAAEPAGRSDGPSTPALAVDSAAPAVPARPGVESGPAAGRPQPSGGGRPSPLARPGDADGPGTQVVASLSPAAAAGDADRPSAEPEPAGRGQAVDLRLEGLDRKLERIAAAVGARAGPGASEEEDRRRLKERLKEALESAQRNRLQLVESERERWLEYWFGICRPDGRIGKAGSRWRRKDTVPFCPNKDSDDLGWS